MRRRRSTRRLRRRWSATEATRRCWCCRTRATSFRATSCAWRQSRCASRRRCSRTDAALGPRSRSGERCRRRRSARGRDSRLDHDRRAAADVPRRRGRWPPRGARNAVRPLRRRLPRAAHPGRETAQARPAGRAGDVPGACGRRSDPGPDRRGPTTRRVIRFVAVGDLMVDVAAEGKGHEARIAVVAGGSALNVACCAARLGAEAAVAGRVGDDAGGRLLLAHLAQRRVRADVGIDPHAATGTVLVVDGETRADRGANARYAPEHLPQLEAEVVLISGHLPEATVAAALARAAAPWVTGCGAEEGVRQLAHGRRLACVTLGGAGAVAARDGEVHRATSPATGTNDDVFGAGDAFAAALLVQLARGAAVPEALALACAAGADLARANTAPAALGPR